MTPEDALIHAEIVLWVVAAAVVPVAVVCSPSLPLWANLCLGFTFVLCTRTPRMLKRVRLEAET